MATIPSVQLFRNSNIISGRSAAIDTLERQKEYVPDGGLILATYSSDNGVKTLLGIVRNSGSENAQITIMDVEGAAENVQDAIDALSAYTNTRLTEEKNARESADNTLQTNIDNLSSSIDTKINAEVTRATKKEAELSSTITSNYTTLSNAIDDEKKRAEAKESDLNAKIQALDGSLGDTVSSTVASGEYSSTDKAIYLKNASGETLSTIDATAFIKDGMVTSVSVVGENLVITFNTDAGHEDILIPISAIFNANNYYTKTEIDTKVDDINSQLSEYGQTTSQALNDLATRLTEEATSRESADTTLQNNINALSGDTKSKIEAEAQARTSADNTLQGNIDALSGSTDTKIANETSARQSADTTLQTNIDNVNSALTAHTADTTVHVTQADKDKWNAPTDLSNYYTKSEVDEKDAAINSTIESYGHVTSQALNDLGTRMDDYGQVTSQSLNDLSTKFGDYYTKTEVDTAISNVDVTGQLQNYYTKSEVDEKDAAINSTIEAYGQVTSQALNDLGTRLDDYGKVTSQSLNDLSTKFGDYYTKTEVDEAIANVDVTGQLQNYYTKAEVDGKDATIQTALDALDAHVNDLNNRIGDTYVKSYIDALEARIAELETKFLNMENNGLQAGEY